MVSTSSVIDTFKTFIEVKYPSYYKRFCQHLKDNPQSATAEAVVFSLMRSIFENVIIGEDVSSGGADFHCTSGDKQFITEVTCQSGWENTVPEQCSAGWFRMITHKLRTKASSKARQVSDYVIPRILAITTEHIGADCLIGPYGAESLMTSDVQIEVPIGDPIGKTNLVSDLKDSVFFRIKDGKFESCRRSISAIVSGGVKVS